MTSGPDAVDDPSVVTAPAAARPLPAVDLVIVHRGEPARRRATAGLFLDQGVPVRLLVVDNGSPETDAGAAPHVAAPGCRRAGAG